MIRLKSTQNLISMITKNVLIVLALTCVYVTQHCSLVKKGDLFTLAQEKVHQDGYQNKKEKSRSKRYIPEGEAKAKRPRLDSTARHERIVEIQDLISDIDRTIGFKQRRIETATATRNFKTCDELSQV